MTANFRLPYPSLILNSSSYHPLEFLALIGGVVACLYRCYLWVLPRPILAIPSSKEAIKFLFGDASPTVQPTVNRKGKKSVRLQCPTERFPTFPSSRPCVLVTDFREATETLVQKTKEINGAKLITNVSGGILPKIQLSMATYDDFQRHRKWLQSFMGIGFFMGLLVRLCARQD